MSSRNKYPYGYFQRSDATLLDLSGNMDGTEFKVPAFLDTAILDGVAGNFDSGNFVLEKNGDKRYPLSIGIEIVLLAEPGDTFKLLLENGSASNTLYNYMVGFRNAKRTGNIEVSESSSSS